MKTFFESLDENKLFELDRFIEQFNDKPNNIISILHYAQNLFDYLSPALQLHIAKKVGMPTSKVNGIVTFYSFFREKKMGKYTIDVCMGTACFVKDSESVINEFKRILEVDGEGLSKDGLFNVNSIRCIGACGIGPVVKINDEIYGHMRKEDVEPLIQTYRAREEHGKN